MPMTIVTAEVVAGGGVARSLEHEAAASSGVGRLAPAPQREPAIGHAEREPASAHSAISRRVGAIPSPADPASGPTGASC